MTNRPTEGAAVSTETDRNWPAVVTHFTPDTGRMRFTQEPYADETYLAIERDETNECLRFRSEGPQTHAVFTVPLAVLGPWRELLDRADPDGSAAGDAHVGARRTPGFTTVRDEDLAVLLEAARHELAEGLGMPHEDALRRVFDMYEQDPPVE